MPQLDPLQQAINKLQALIAAPGTDPKDKALMLRQLEQLAQTQTGSTSALPTESGGLVDFEPVSAPVAFEEDPGLGPVDVPHITRFVPGTGVVANLMNILGKFAPNVQRGLAAGATAPMRFLGGDIEPPTEQTLPVRLAETAGSLGTITALGMASGGAIPALASRALLPRTLHAALTLGLVEAGATEPGGPVIKNFAHGALIGAPFGALFAPGLSMVQRMLVGAGLSAVFGGPAPVTGTKEEEILLGTAMGLIGGKEPPLSKRGTAPTRPPITREPVQGELFPETAYAKPGTQFELPGVKAVLEKFTLPKMPLPTTAQIGVQLPLPLGPRQLELPLASAPTAPGTNVQPGRLPDGRSLSFTPEAGGLLVHGTQAPFAAITTSLGKAEPIYLTDDFNEGVSYAHGEHLGGGPGRSPIVQSFVAKPGKTIDINRQVEDSITYGGEVEMAAILDEARINGYSYATYDHPAFQGPADTQRVVVALQPQRDLVPSKGYAATKQISKTDEPLAAFGIKDPTNLRKLFATAAVNQFPILQADVLVPNPAGHPRLLMEMRGHRSENIRGFDKMVRQLANTVPEDFDNYDIFIVKPIGIKVDPETAHVFARPAGTDLFIDLERAEIKQLLAMPKIPILDGKTIHPPVPPPVIVSETPFIYEGYHGTVKQESRFEFKPGYQTHVGTYKSALDRVYAVEEPSLRDLPGRIGERIFPVRVELEKPYGTALTPVHDADANNSKLIGRLIKEGYDGILYRNSAEDYGSLSLVVFDPAKSIKIVGQQIVPGTPINIFKIGDYYKKDLAKLTSELVSRISPKERSKIFNLDNLVKKAAEQIELPFAVNKEQAKAIINTTKAADTESSPVPRSFDHLSQAQQGFAQMRFEKEGVSITLPDGRVFKAKNLDDISDAISEVSNAVTHGVGDSIAFTARFKERFKEGLEIYQPAPPTERFNAAFKYALEKAHLKPGEMQEALKALSGLTPQMPKRFQASTEIQAPKQLLLNLGEMDQQMKLPLVEAEAKTNGAEVSVLPEGYSLKDFQGRVQYFKNLDDVAKAIALTGRDIPDITPPGVPPIGGPPGSHPTAPMPGDVPPMPLSDINLGILPLSRYLVPLKPWAENVELKSNGLIPAYKIWKLISRGQLEWLKSELPYIDKGKAIVAQLGTKRGRATYYYLGAQSEAERTHAISAFGITKNEIPLMEQFRKNFDDLFVDLAVARFAPYEKDYVPLRGKNATEIDAAYPKHARPSGFDFWADHFRRGDIKVKEDNLFKLYFQYVRAGTKSRYFEPFYKEAHELIDGLTRQGAHTTPGISSVYSRLNLFLDEARNLPDQMKRDLASSADNILRKLGVDADARQVGHFTDFLLTMNYAANMAYRYSLVLRNMTQSMLVIPYHGAKAWWTGVRESGTEAGKAEAIKAGLSFEPALPYETETLTQFGRLGTIARKGTASYRHVDERNRAIAYLTAKRVFQKEGRLLQQGKISWEKFQRRTNVDSYHPIEKLEILAEARRGNIEGAAELAGLHLHQNTQWIYLRGNEPQMFSGTVGRLLGQYGTWPTWYLQYITRLARFGSPTTKLANFTRLVAMYTAVEFAAQQLFGSDVSSWLYFGPLNYGGGPFMDFAKNAQALVFGSEADKKIAASRLAIFPLQLIPGSGLVREIKKAAEQPDLQKSVFTLLGFPPSDPYKDLLQPATPQRAPGMVDFEAGAPQ